MNLDAVLSFLAAALRTATPIALATLACTISERAGVINIGIEGTMIASAFMGAVGAYYSGSAWVGLLCGAAAGAVSYTHLDVYKRQPHKHPFKVLGKILKTDSGTHGLTDMRSRTSPDSTIQRMRN